MSFKSFASFASFTHYDNYPKFRVNAYNTKFNVQIRRALWPFWHAYEDHYYGIETYDTFDLAQKRVLEILKFRLDNQIDKALAKMKITGESLSMKDYIDKYPEEFL